MRFAQSALLPAGLFRTRFSHLGVGFFPLRDGTRFRRAHLVIHAIVVTKKMKIEFVQRDGKNYLCDNVQTVWDGRMII